MYIHGGVWDVSVGGVGDLCACVVSVYSMCTDVCMSIVWGGCVYM